jgi:drug/metabolite transporter (DMT)-like permease
VPAAIGLAFQKYVSPVTVAFIYALEPVMGALAGRWLLGESLSFVGWVGGLLILSGALLNAWPESGETLVKPAPQLE